MTFVLTEPLYLSEISARLLTLDDLLAAARYQETGDWHAGQQLPLAKLIGADGWWVYRASCWRPVGAIQIATHRIYRRQSDAVRFDWGVTRPPNEESSGPWRDYVIRLLRISTPAIQFQCVGDRTEVERLAKRLTNLGKKRSLNGGRCLPELTQVQLCDADESVARDGVATRPIPMPLAEQEGITGLRLAVAYRPPYWIAAHRAPCVVPPVPPEDQVVAAEACGAALLADYR